MTAIVSWILGKVTPYLAKGLPYFIIVIVVGAGAGIVYLRMSANAAKISSLTTQVAASAAVIAQEKSVNEQDQAAIKLLKLQAAAWQHAESVVAADYAQEQQAVGVLNASISEQSQSVATIQSDCVPSSATHPTDGFVAPVLNSTLLALKNQNLP